MRLGEAHSEGIDQLEEVCALPLEHCGENSNSASDTGLTCQSR